MHKMPMLQPNRHQTETEGSKAKKNERVGGERKKKGGGGVVVVT